MNLQDIERRMNEIATEIEQDGADLDALETELRSLREKKNEILQRETRKANILQNVLQGAGNQIIKPVASTETRTYKIDDVEYRTAWAKTLLYQPLTKDEQKALVDVNKRAASVALTTTSETFAAPSDTVDGVNNGGLFIPKYVSDKLLDEIALDSPILGAVAKMAVAGMLSFPYKKSADPAKWRKEGVPNDDESIEWAQLSLTTKELSKTIRITWKLEAMTPDGFISYIISELRTAMVEALADSVIYGNGNLDITGLYKTNLSATYDPDADNIIDIIVNAGALIPKKKRVGVKLYISDALGRKIALQKDSHGDYIMPPINGGAISKIGPYAVEVEPYLNDDDFILGNLSRGYVLNEVESTSITKDISGKNRINDYTAYGIWGGNVMPDTIVYGTAE